MKNKQYLDELPKGGIVKNKRVLSALKRKGLIFDYSPWGYLEIVKVTEKETKEYWDVWSYLFPNGNAPKKDRVYVEKKDDLDQYRSGTIEYLGHKFNTKHLDGCMNAYLQKISGDSNNEVHPRISAWGAIY